MNAATAPSTRHTAGLKPKFTPVTRSFLRSQTDPKLGWFLMMLEDLSMERTTGFDDTWGIVYDADLRPTFGSDDTIGRLWKQAEDDDQPGGPYLKRVRNANGARIGFIWLRRPTDRPVATPATFAQAQAELVAAVAGRRGRARTIPIPSEDPCTYRRFAGAPTADLRVHLPQICGGSAGAPYSNRARSLEEENTEKTTTTRAKSSSSSFNPSPQNQDQEPERPVSVLPLGPVASPPIPAAAASNHVEPESPPVASELPANLAIDQALLSITIVRMIALTANFKHAPNWSAEKARNFILGLVKFFRCPLWWVHNAIEQAHQRRDAARGKKAVEKAAYVRNILEHWTKGDGDPGEDPTLGKTSGQDSTARASPSRKNEARQVLAALRGCGLDIEAHRGYCEDTSQASWSYTKKGDWSNLDASLKRKLEALKPEIRELVRLETEARHAQR
jgi:hypothetical protein